MVSLAHLFCCRPLAAVALATILPACASGTSLVKVDLSRIKETGLSVTHVGTLGSPDEAVGPVDDDLRHELEALLADAGLTLVKGEEVAAWFAVVASTRGVPEHGGLLLTKVTVSLSHEVAWPDTGAQLKESAQIWWHFAAFVGTKEDLYPTLKRVVLSIAGNFVADRTRALEVDSRGGAAN